MKKTAYTSKNVLEKNKHWKSFVPAKAALLVIDVQRYFTDPASHAFVPAYPHIKRNIIKLIDSFKRKKLPVFCTIFAVTPGEKDPIGDWWGHTVEQGSSEAELDLAHDEHDLVLVKSSYDAFHETDLDEALQKRGVDTVVISGVLSNLCCETTARAAFNRGYNVFFVTDATAAYNEEMHLATLLNLSYGFATPLTTQDLCSTIA